MNAKIYPKAFCQAVCEGIAAQKKIGELGLCSQPLMSIEEMAKVAKLRTDETPSEFVHERHSDEDMIAYDDQSGEELDPTLVAAARKEEIHYFREMGVYEKVELKRCWDETGRAPIANRWIDINKGDSLNTLYRSRLVAK